MFIATVNKLIMFDWSSKSIVKILETGSIRERVRYVKFCPYGNYLYTAITNVDRPEDRRAQHETPPPVMPYR